MLKWVTLRNFQKHKKLRIDLDPRITIIMGRSDIGKSSILRALRWLMLNKGPTKVNRKGSKFAKVTLGLTHHKITRSKSSKANKYIVNGETFKALKKGGMPVQVESILGVGDINFQRQLDSHYWLSLTPSQISAELNKIVNLTEIDGSIAHSAARVRKVKSKLEVSNERISELNRSIENLEWVHEFDKDLIQIEKLEKQSAKKAVKIERLELVINQAKKSKKAITNGRVARSDKRNIQGEISAFEKLSARIETCESLVSQYEHHQKAKAYDADRTNVKELEALVLEYNGWGKTIQRLEGLIEELESCQSELARNQRLAGKVKRKLKKIGTLCPTCGNPLKK